MKVKASALTPKDQPTPTDQIWAIFLIVFTGILFAALVVLTVLATIDSNSSAPAEQSSSSDAEIASQENAYYGIICTIPTPADSAPRLVLDQSYWRLARQGKARVIPGTEQYFGSNPSSDMRNLANYTEINLSEMEGEFSWYNIYDDGVLNIGGTVICRLYDEDQQVTVSVPTLSPELQELVDSRGDNYILVYTESTSTESAAQLLLYQGNATLSIVHPDGEPALVFAFPKPGGVFCHLFTKTNSSSIGSEPFNYNTSAVPMDLGEFYTAGQLRATATTFSASAEQVRILKTWFDQAESEPLPSEILQNLTTSPE